MPRIKLARLLAGTGGKLPNQVFIGIAQHVFVCGKLRQAIGNGLDDGAEFGVLRGVAFAQLFRIQIDLGKQPAEGTGKGFVFDVIKTLLQVFSSSPFCVRAISAMLPPR